MCQSASDLPRPGGGSVGVVQLEQGWHPVNTATNDKQWTIDGIEGVRDKLFSGVDTGVPPFLMG